MYVYIFQFLQICKLSGNEPEKYKLREIFGQFEGLLLDGCVWWIIFNSRFGFSVKKIRNYSEAREGKYVRNFCSSVKNLKHNLKLFGDISSIGLIDSASHYNLGSTPSVV